jgi:hypothetical protein
MKERIVDEGGERQLTARGRRLRCRAVDWHAAV